MYKMNTNNYMKTGCTNLTFAKTLGRNNWGLTMIALGAIFVMAAGTIFDIRATLALIRYPLPSWTPILGRTLFMGDLPGLNDMVVLLIIAVLAVYIIGHIARCSQYTISSFRPHAGFILTSGVVVGLLMVHGLKYLMGRARPFLVLNEDWPYSYWFVFGPHSIFNGTFNASFPSGHTAQMFLLLSVAYVLAADPLWIRPAKIAGIIWGVFALCLCLVVGVARCATQSHWLTDILGSICFGWLLMHWIYFRLLSVPEQRRYYGLHGHLPLLPLAWELILCGYIFLIGAGALLLVYIIRNLICGGPSWFGLLLPAGILAVQIGLTRFRRLHRKVIALISGCRHVDRTISF
jgi:membrane-associated phospholipid phosphatase